MSADLIFELPLPENIANSRMHWAVKYAKQQRYWAMLDLLAVSRRLPMPPPTPMPAATALAVVRTFRKMDQDNAASRMKWVLDWLQTRGYVVDDKYVDLTVATEAVPLNAVGIRLSLSAEA